MKRDISTFLYVVGIGLLLFFIYAAISVGWTAKNALAVHRSDLANFGAAVVSFLVRNIDIVTVAVTVLIIARLFARAPGPLRF